MTSARDSLPEAPFDIGGSHGRRGSQFVETMRCGVVTREEAYLEGRFGDAYRDYKARVRRWL